MKFRSNAELLRYLYADLRRIAEVTTKDIELHTADRRTSGVTTLRGVDAVMAHEAGLIAATGGTLVMDVTDISANDHFGTVLGTLRAELPETIAMPFCGVWRFENGRAVEHWENAYDAADLAQRLSVSAGRKP